MPSFPRNLLAERGTLISGENPSVHIWKSGCGFEGCLFRLLFLQLKLPYTIESEDVKSAGFTQRESPAFAPFGRSGALPVEAQPPEQVLANQLWNIPIGQRIENAFHNHCRMPQDRSCLLLAISFSVNVIRSAWRASSTEHDTLFRMLRPEHFPAGLQPLQ